MTRLRWTRVVLIGSMCVFGMTQRGNANPCVPSCSFTYTVSVRYTVNGALKFGIITGADSVNDGDLDRNLGSLQARVQQVFGPQAVFADVDQLTLGTQTAPALAATDVLLVRDNDVLLWINAPNSSAAGLHVSTTTASTKSHAFSFKVIAEGSESPFVEFDYTIHAAGAESFPKAVRKTEPITIAYHDSSDETCRKIEGAYVCLDPGCTVSSAKLQKDNVSRNSIESISIEGQCAKYNVECSGTDGWMYNNCREFFTDCRKCGSWYEATVIVDGICTRSRAWSRAVSGVGKARKEFPGNAEVVFTTDYAKSGGLLGSVLADTTAVDKVATYSGEISNCRADGVAIDCDSAVHFGTIDSVLEARADYTRQVQQVKTGNAALDSTQGIRSFGTFTFTPPNHDLRYSIEATFMGVTYSKVNSDEVVDVGPFSLWISGTNGDELFGSFDRSSVPSAVIDSILPNPGLLKEPVTFIGHGLGAFTGYEWRTHRVDQPVPTLETKATFTKDDLVAGKHLISFRVLGGQISPFVYANLSINQPPLAFINRVANVNDAAHPSIALLLRDGIPSDPFQFDGSGIDFDGSIVEWKWESNIDHVVGSKPVFKASLSLGVHTITLRVRDNRGIWSGAVTTTVTVRRPPVLLVHGICGGESTWEHLIDSYAGGSGSGWLGPDWKKNDIVNKVFDPDGNGMTNDSPRDVAVMVAAEIEAMKSQFGVRTVNLVVHSMGGLASRLYIQGPAFRRDVNKLVMLGTPNHGSSSADVMLISNGYSMEEVELYVPTLRLRKALLIFGALVDVFDALGIFGDLVCTTQDSPGLHSLRPHGTLVRGLNKTLKDEGTEDYTPTTNPDEAISKLVSYFLIHGSGVAISHTHLPRSLENAIYIATLGAVNLDHMDLIWIRAGDTAVTDNSLALHSVTQSDYDHSHGDLHDSEDSMNQARKYLLDDPPPPPGDEPGLDEVASVQLLGTFYGKEVPSAKRTIDIDAAASRLKVVLTFEAGDANSPPFRTSPHLQLRLVSPAGVVYDTSAPVSGFTSVNEGATLQAILENPVPGSWDVQVTGTNPGLRYSVVMYQESGTFLAIGLSSHQNEPGQPVQIAGYLQSGALGTTGASVYAAIAAPDGATVSVPMVEDPRYAGLYVGTYTPAVLGTFKVLVAADVVMPGGAVVTRLAYSNFDARLRAELSVEISSSAGIAKHGDALRLTAVVRNVGKANALATPVQFFEGLPQERGRLLGTRTVDVPAGGEARPSVLWNGSAGGHHFVVVADPMNATEADDEKPHVSEMVVVTVDEEPPVARAGPDQIASVGQTLVLDGRASTDNDAIVKYEWKFPTLRSHMTIEGAYVSVPGGLPGPDAHLVELVVTDASGNVATDTLAVRMVDATDTTRPVADAGEEMSAIVGAPVAFDGMHSRDDFGIAYATWDVDVTRDSDGDGDRGNDQDLAGLSPTYLRGYARAGRYRARLTVRDAAGNGPVTSTVIVNVVDPAANCTVTVPPGGNLQGVLSAARSGETICLQAARYRTSGLVMTNAGVTLEGQGAVLEYVAPPSPAPSSDIGPIGIRAETSAGADGVTVSHMTVRGFTIGLGAAAGNHRFIGNTIEGGVAAVVASFSSTAIEHNRVRGAFYGYVLDGTGHRVVNNSASGNSIGFVVGGSGHVIAGNDACANSIVDLQLNGAASGRDNACGTTAGWSDAGRSGCTFRCGDIRIPQSGLIIDRNTFFAAGTYELDKGLVVTGSGVQVHFAGTEITGPEGGSIPGIEVLNASGANVSGATITGFAQGVRVTGGSAVELSDLEISNAEVGVEASGGRNGALRDVRVTRARQGLRLDGATSQWTVENGQFTGDVDVAGSGHLLSANRIDGRVAISAGASGARLRGNTIVSKSVGISVDSANAAEIAGNTVRAGGTAIVVRGSSRSKIVGNAVFGHRGIALDGGDTHTVFDNRVEGVGAGVHLSGTRSVVLEKNTVTVRNGTGVVLNLSSGNRLTGNDLRQSRHGLDLQSSNVNRILGNVFAEGMTPGITLNGSHANDVVGNTLSDIWPGGVLATASSRNRFVANKLRPSGASSREITALGISLASGLRGSPNLPIADVERAVARGWESLHVFAGRDRIRGATGARFFEGLASSIGVFMELGRAAHAADVDRDLIRNATSQMARGANLVVRQAIRDAREIGGDPSLVRTTEALLAEGERLAALGRPDLAVASFGRAWTVIRQSSVSPARLSATMTVTGVFTERSEVVYAAIVTNVGPRAQRDNPGDEFADRLPADLDTIDVTASSGQANLDHATNGITWNGSIASGASVRLTIRATIKSGTAFRSVSNQGTVRFDARGDGLNDDVALTDDPTIEGSADATAFTVLGVQLQPETIPLLSPELLMILILLLGTVAGFQAKRSPRR